MKIFVFAYNRYETMTTSNLLFEEGIEHFVMCHTGKDVEKFRAGGTLRVDAAHVIVTGNPKGLTRQRNSALQMLKEGEWAVFMNDDLHRVTMLRQYEKMTTDKIEITPENIKQVDDDFKKVISCKTLFRLLGKIRQQAEAEGARLVGFCPHTNTRFRGNKVTRKGLVDGRLWLFKKEPGMRFDENVNCLEDHDFTAYNLCRYGRVHVENWICPEFRRMTTGGFGTLNERENELRREAAYLIEKWPFVFEYKSKAGYPPKTQLKFRRDGIL